VLIPVQCEYFALEGLTSLLDTVKAVRTRLNPHLEIDGILRTMYDVRNNLGNDVSAQLAKHFGDKLLRSVIPRNIRLAEAPSHGQPINLYDRESRGAIAYFGLAGELLRRDRAAATTGSTQSVAAPAPVSSPPAAAVGEKSDAAPAAEAPPPSIASLLVR